MVDAMFSYLSKHSGHTFYGLRIDTRANRTSIMSCKQYDSYCRSFGYKTVITQPQGRIVRGIGRYQDAAGMASIQIPFQDLGLILDVDFKLLSERVPPLLSMRDMVGNSLDFSLQDRTITFEGLSQVLKFDNYFLIHEWVHRKCCFPCIPNLNSGR